MLWLTNFPWLAKSSAVEPPPGAPTPESLEQTKARWNQAVVSADAAERGTVIDEMWPNRKDVDILFPDHAEKLTRFLELAKSRMKKQVENAPEKELQEERERRRNVRKIETINVRINDKSGRFKAILKIIPPDVPVYRIVEKGGGGSSTYLFLNGRWIHFMGLESVPEILSKLDEMIKRADDANSRLLKP